MLLYSLEVPQQGASDEYPQHVFLSRNKKNIDRFWLKKAPYQELCVTVITLSIGTNRPEQTVLTKIRHRRYPL